MSASVKQQRGQTQSQALCLASSSPMQGQIDPQMRQMFSFMMQGMRSAMGLDNGDLDSPPSRGGANLQILKPKAKQTSSPPSAAGQESALLSKVGGSSFPPLENQAAASTSPDAVSPEPAGSIGRKDEEAYPSEFAHERKSALKPPAGSKTTKHSPNKVTFDPVTHSVEMATAMKEILRLVICICNIFGPTVWDCLLVPALICI